MRVNFDRERSWWDAKAPREEIDLVDESINRTLRWREIERHLDGVESILDIGGGTGAFSIPLARRGFKVTHVDFSPAMLGIARQKAEGIENIEFVEANSTDLPYEDQSFDLVLNMDGAISFCGSEAGRAVAEACRVAKNKVIMTVSNRVALIPNWMRSSIKVCGGFIPAVREMVENGEWHLDQFPENALAAKGATQDYVGACKAFLPDELQNLLEQQNMSVSRIGGIGSLACLCGDELIRHIISDEKLLTEFVDMCDYYDEVILPKGPGTWQRAGLIAVASRANRTLSLPTYKGKTSS